VLPLLADTWNEFQKDEAALAFQTMFSTFLLLAGFVLRYRGSGGNAEQELLGAAAQSRRKKNCIPDSPARAQRQIRSAAAPVDEYQHRAVARAVKRGLQLRDGADRLAVDLFDDIA